MPDGVVGLYVNYQSCQEQDDSQEKPWIPEPGIGIHCLRRQEENPLTLNKGIGQVENDTHEHDKHRHPAFSLDQPGKDKGTLQVMDLEQQEKDEWHQIPFAG